MVLVLLGAALVILAVLLGQMNVGFVLFVIPVVYGSSILGLLGAGLIVLGVFVFFWAGVSSAPRGEGEVENAGGQPTAKREIGGVVLIGPIPIVFGSSNRAALYAMIAAGVLVTLLLLALILLR